MSFLNYKLFLPLFVLPFVLMILIPGCSEQPPATPDGENNFNITAVWDSSGTGQESIPMSNAIVILISEYGRIESFTDSKGQLNLNGLPSSDYKIAVRMIHPSKPGFIVTGTANLSAEPTQSYNIKINCDAIKNSSLVINELYFSGPRTDFFYFEDQFIELYNFSNVTQYLDGLIIMNSTPSEDRTIAAGEDSDGDGDIDIVHSAYSFPGLAGQKKYPIKPGEFFVIALEAVDHRKFVSKSIDLSDADWEFKNEFNSTEFDNPLVPDLSNMLPGQNFRFYMNLEFGVVLLCSGQDKNLQDGMDISTVLDGIEYQINYTSRKTCDEQIDKSFALCPARYSGRSLQRIEPGSDSNDSSVDFEIIDHPTPGYQ